MLWLRLTVTYPASTSSKCRFLFTFRASVGWQGRWNPSELHIAFLSRKSISRYHAYSSYWSTVQNYYLPLPVIMMYGSVLHRCKVSPYHVLQISQAVSTLPAQSFLVVFWNFMDVINCDLVLKKICSSHNMVIDIKFCWARKTYIN